MYGARSVHLCFALSLLGCAAATSDDIPRSSAAASSAAATRSDSKATATASNIGSTPSMVSAPQPPPRTSEASQPPRSEGPNDGASTGPSAGPALPPAVADVPCDVARVVSNNCTLCHSPTPKFGAPMPLMGLQDFHGNAKGNPARSMADVIVERVSAVDVTRRMPPASSAALTSEQSKTLTTWLKAGMPAQGALCAIQEGPQGGASGERTAGGSPSPIEYDDLDLRCYRFLAHAPGDKAQPYAVDQMADRYTSFQFMPPWQGTVYARSFKVVPGNAQAIHHWIFYKDSEAGTDGAVVDELGVHPDGQFIHGWAPGGTDWYLDPDIGQELPGNVSYTLEAHYNNTTGANTADASGIEVCVTPEPPKNVASVAWLGTDYLLGDTTASGTCRPLNKEPVQIIGVTPHMHKRGRNMKIVIHRAAGGDETFVDQPFDFSYQRTYSFNTRIMPGDQITTTCSFSEPAVFGYGSNDEMCYAFIWYYPKLTLVNDDPLGSIHGPDTCLN